MFEQRDGEEQLRHDPADGPFDAQLVFIGLVRSPWILRQDCPKNMREARTRGQSATVEIDEAFRAGLTGLGAPCEIFVMTWLDRSPRNLIVQKPRHATDPKGVFALRTPVRPNPIGLHATRLLSLDRDAGVLVLEAIDVLDGTPVLDIKPFFPQSDAYVDGFA
jgi:tRNA-Thr(GGU) m(6)t(6)A37 methyltransferase TsaA